MEEERSSIIKAVTTPLGFFALSLLIVEGFLGITLIFAKVSNPWFYWTGMIIGAALFAGVVRGVYLLVKYVPQNIVKAGRDYVEIEKERINAGGRTTLLKKSTESTAENVEYSHYIDEDEPIPEEVDAAADSYMQSEIDRRRGK